MYRIHHLRLKLVLITAVSILLTALLTAHFISSSYAQSTAAEEQLLFLPIITNNYDPNWQWQEPISITLSSLSLHTPVMIIDHQGNLHIFWDTDSTPRFIYHSYQTPDGWTTPLPVSSNLGTSDLLYPPLVGVDGSLHLVWRNYLGYGIEEPYRLLYARFDGNAWQPEEEIYRTTNSTVQAMPHQTLNGDIRVTLLDSSYTTVAYHLTPMPGSWGISPPIQPSHSTSWVWPDMQGGIHFYGGINPLAYSYWRDNQFLLNNYQIPGSISGRQTQLDSQNNLHTFWKGSVPIPGGIVTGLSYQCLQHDLNWQSTQVLSGQNAVTGETPKAANTSGQVVLGWEQTADTSFWLGLWNGCKQEAQKEIPLPEPDIWALKAMVMGKDAQRVCAAFRRDYAYTNYVFVCADINR